MKKYLKLTGLILLYLLVFLVIQVIVGMVCGIIYVIQQKLHGQAIDLSGITNYLTQISYLIIAISYSLTFLAYWLIFKIRKLKIFAIFKSSRLNIQTSTLLLFGGVALSFLTMSLLYLMSISKLFQNYDELMEMILGGNNFWGILFSVGIFGPICEEIFFRGVIFNELKDKMPIAVAMIIQAGLFGLVHGNLLQGTYAFILGLILALVYMRFNSILAPMIVHMFYNLTSLLASRNITDQFLQKYIDIFALSSLVVSVVFFIYIGKRNKNNLDDHIANIDG